LGAGSREGGAAAAAPVGIMRVGGRGGTGVQGPAPLRLHGRAAGGGEKRRTRGAFGWRFRPNQAHGVQHPASGCLQQP
jgi:hypothetical protein